LLHLPTGTRADPHDADAGEPEADGERAMGETTAAQTTDLVVALGLDAAGETAGEDGGLRDADAERLRDDPQRPTLAAHPDDLILGRRRAARPLAGGRHRARIDRDHGRIP